MVNYQNYHWRRRTKTPSAKGRMSSKLGAI